MYTIMLKEKNGRWYIPASGSPPNGELYGKSKEFLRKEGLKIRRSYGFIVGFRVIPISEIKVETKKIFGAEIEIPKIVKRRTY